MTWYFSDKKQWKDLFMISLLIHLLLMIISVQNKRQLIFYTSDTCYLAWFLLSLSGFLLSLVIIMETNGEVGDPNDVEFSLKFIVRPPFSKFAWSNKQYYLF